MASKALANGIYMVIAAKLSGHLVGLALNVAGESLVWQAAVLGIAPIWCEVLATALTGVEPSLEKRRLPLCVDTVVDAWVFVMGPSLWFFNEVLVPLRSDLLIFISVSLALGLFVVCGLGRLRRFWRYGLQDNLYFIGLPVTYTGYQWLLLLLCKNWLGANHVWVAGTLILLCGVAFAMISPHIKIKRTMTRYDTT